MSEPDVMRIRNAIEVMKMLGPLSPKFTQYSTTIKVMRSILEQINEEHPPAAFRLLALMEGKSIEQVAAELEVNMDPNELFGRLLAGFERNDLVSLMDFAHMIGLSEARWIHHDG